MLHFLLIILSCSQGFASANFFENLAREAKKLELQEQARKSQPSEIAPEKGLESQPPKVIFKSKKTKGTTLLLEELLPTPQKNEEEGNFIEKDFWKMSFIKEMLKNENHEKYESVMEKFEEKINKETDPKTRAILQHNRAWLFEKKHWDNKDIRIIRQKKEYWGAAYPGKELLVQHKMDNVFFYCILNEHRRTENNQIIKQGQSFDRYSAIDQRIIRAMHDKCGAYLAFHKNIKDQVYRELHNNRFKTIDKIRHEYSEAIGPENKESLRSRDKKDGRTGHEAEHSRSRSRDKKDGGTGHKAKRDT